eukprot:2640629-Heterocapsa_arctica.AAC.1
MLRQRGDALSLHLHAFGLWVGAQGFHAIDPKLPPAATHARRGPPCAGGSRPRAAPVPSRWQGV